MGTVSERNFPPKVEESPKFVQNIEEDSQRNLDGTLKRLHAAVNKEPNPSSYNRPSYVESQGMSSSSKGTLNSILQRMTGLRR